MKDSIGKGLNIVQDEIGKGKGKVDVIKETSKINERINAVADNRATLLIEIGNLAYLKVRTGEITDEELIEKCKSLLGFDCIIYENKNKLKEIEKSQEVTKCSCGEIIDYDSKFCSSCGGAIEKPVEEELNSICAYCENQISEESLFCPCCGKKVAE